MEPFALILALATTSTSAESFGFLLVVSDVEGAIVRVDGERVGRAPVPTIRLPVGVHTVEVEEIGYGRYLTRVEITENAFTHVDANVSPRALPKLSPAERLGIRTNQEGQGSPMITRPWFLAIAGAVAASVVAVGLVMSSGGDFVPEGELGNSKTDEWRRF